MKRIYYVALLFVASVANFNCQKEVSYALIDPPPVTNNGNPSPLSATVQGNIVDELGVAAAGVVVRVGNKNATTDENGYFRIVAAALDKNGAMATAEKTGYFKSIRSFNATTGANHIVIKLIKKTAAGSIDAAAGGTVSLTNGSKIKLPSNAVVKANDGTAYSGSVQVYAAYIDPTADDIGQTVPGSFLADDKANKRVTLASYGMMAVELASSAGEKLQIAPNAVATLTMPIPSSIQSSAPATIALWSIDEAKGIWKEDGSAVKDGNDYIGEVKHFSFWNCDIGIPGITLSFTLKTGKDVPLVHSSVRLTTTVANSPSQAFGWTDSLGQISGLVPLNQPILMEVLDPCNNVVYSKNIGSFIKNTDIGTITIINSSSPSLITIEGQLKNCSNLPVTEGYVIINSDNTTRYVSVNDKGEFATSFLRCTGGSATCEIIGVDEGVQQQGNPVTVTISNNTNAGTVIACGISSTQFINYSIDGTEHSISSATNDSLTSVTYPTLSNPPLSTWISGLKMADNKYISLSFLHAAAVGTYPANSLSLQGFDSVSTVQPFNVVLTSYPASTGGFYEGTFSGKFSPMNSTQPIHNISGSFRIRRL